MSGDSPFIRLIGGPEAIFREERLGANPIVFGYCLKDSSAFR